MGFTTEMVGCWWSFTNMVGKLPNWNDCVGDGCCWDIWKIFGLLFLQVPCKKNWMKPTTIDVWSEISHVDAPLRRKVLIEVRIRSHHITSSPTNHRNSRRGSSPRCFDSREVHPHPLMIFCGRHHGPARLAHLLLAMCSTSLGVVAISQVWVDL